MKLNRQWFKDNNACTDSYQWICALINTNESLEDISIIEQLIKEDRLNWANWTICRIFTYEQKIKYAIFAAEQVIDIYEKKYPNNDSPRKAIIAAKTYLESPTEKNKKAA
jgi:hypothetical protein